METKKIKFFKQDNRWYADIPNHTLEENEMVMGADILLDYLCRRDGNEVTLTVSEERPDWYGVDFEFHMKEHDDEGATYEVGGREIIKFIEHLDGNVFGDEPTVWLCNVMHDVFGEHPKHIYIYTIEN